MMCTAVAIVAVLFTISGLTVFQKNKLRYTVKIIVLFWLWCVLMAFIQGADKPLRLAELEMILYTGMIAFLVCFTKLPVMPLKIVLYLILVFYYYQYFILEITSYGINDETSGAVNTMILLSIAVTIQVLDYRDNQRIALLPSALILPISVVSWNRTGFFASILYMVTVFFLGSNMVRKKSTRWVLISLLVILVIVVVIRYNDWFLQSALFDKIEDSGLNNMSRSSIWAGYFDSLDVVNILFGRAIDNSHPLVGGFLNPHNSFLMLHSYTGVLSIAIIVLMIKRLWVFLKYNRFVFLLFLVLIIRCFFDMIFFFHPFDYAFYLFIFSGGELAIKHKEVSIKIV